MSAPCGEITVRVRAFASLREALGFADRHVPMPIGASVAGLLARLAAENPEARLPDRRLVVAINRHPARPDSLLEEGDEVALLPPVSGGSPKLFEVTSGPISLDEVVHRLTAPDRGGVTVFAGAVRGVTGPTPDSGGHDTDYLEYEAYPEMAEASFAQIAAEARERWPSIAGVAVVHRVGRLEVGDTAIAIAVAAPHRRDTFDACRYVIDRVKAISPVWKREVGSDGSLWVEGPESQV
jgi:molybdopterin synthase catalytic subunit